MQPRPRAQGVRWARTCAQGAVRRAAKAPTPWHWAISGEASPQRAAEKMDRLRNLQHHGCQQKMQAGGGHGPRASQRGPVRQQPDQLIGAEKAAYGSNQVDPGAAIQPMGAPRRLHARPAPR
jgi:hypothetical protein